ncbi:hypothetical protein GEMRC1_009925 [Eukaryota sp. GEM-RC1]
MILNNRSLLVLRLNVSKHTIFEFENILISFKRNSTLKTVSFHSLNLSHLTALFKYLSVNTIRLSFDIAPNCIDVKNGVFCYSSYTSTQLNAEEVSSLQILLTSFNLKKLILRKCRFYEESITILCDSISSNNTLNSSSFEISVNSVNRYSSPFSRSFRTETEDFSQLINALQLNANLKQISLFNDNMCFKNLLYIFELVSSGRLTANIQVSPHFVDVSLGLIHYHNFFENGDLILLLNALQLNLPIKRVCSRGLKSPSLECLLYRLEILSINKSAIDLMVDPFFVDFEEHVFVFSPKMTTQITTDEVSSLIPFLQYCGIKELTINNCRFSIETFTILCDLIRVNNHLTSIDLSDCHLDDDMILTFTSALQSNCSLRVVNLSKNHFGLKSLLIIFHLVSVNKLTRDIQVSPHSIDFSRGLIRFESQIENCDLHFLLDALKSNVPIKRVECLGLRTPSLQGLVNLFEIFSINRSVIDLNVSPFFIDFEKNLFGFSPENTTNIPTEDVTSLQQFLQYCGIKGLTLNNCRFSIKTFTLLCDFIRVNNHLTSVDLSECNLDDEYLSIFVCLIQFDSFLNLKILKIRNNFFSNNGVITLAEALKLDSVVTEINLGGNSIDSDTIELVKRISNNRIKF